MGEGGRMRTVKEKAPAVIDAPLQNRGERPATGIRARRTGCRRYNEKPSPWRTMGRVDSKERAGIEFEVLAERASVFGRDVAVAAQKH
jgi:hypothetical protein